MAVKSVEDLTFAMEVVEEFTGETPKSGANASIWVTFRGLGADVIAAVANGGAPLPSPSPGAEQSSDAPASPPSAPSAGGRRELGLVVRSVPVAQARRAGRGLAEESSCEDLEITIDMAGYNMTDLPTAYDEAMAAINDAAAIIAATVSTSGCAPEVASFNMDLWLDKSYRLDEVTVGRFKPRERIRLNVFPDPPQPPAAPRPSPPPPMPPPPSPPPGFPLPAALAAAMADLDNLLATDDSGNETDAGDALGAASAAAAALTDMFNNLGEGVPLSDALLGSVSSLADSLGASASTAEGDDGEAPPQSAEDAAAAAAAMKNLLASVAAAIAANSVPGEPPKQIKGGAFAMSVQNAILPDLSACEADDSCPEPELDPDNPGAALGTGKVNLTKMSARNASNAPAMIVSTKMSGLEGAPAAVMAVTNVPGTPGKGSVLVAPGARRLLAAPGAPPSAAPAAFSSGSAATKLAVSVKDERRRKLREIRRVLGAKDANGPKCATAYVASSNAKSVTSCLPAYLESMACEVVLNETFVNMTDQETQQKEVCGKMTGPESYYAPFCLADTKLLQVMETIWKNQTILCQNISAPCSGPDRGTCNITADVCMCSPEWIGLQCENQPQAVIGGDNGVSKDGAKLQGLNPDTGAALIQADGPADMSIMTETVEPPPMATSGTMKVNLPKVMTLEELIATLQDMGANEYIIPFSWFFFMIIVFKLCFAYDDSKAYVQFFPAWHEWLTGGRTNSMMWKIIGAQMVIVLCTDHIAMIFFILPTLPFQRSMRWMCLLVILHAKLAILALFYGPEPPPEAPPCLMFGIPCAIVAQMIDIGAGVFFQQLSLQVFMNALIKNSDLSAVQAQVEKQAKKARQKTRWILAFRQTVPRSKVRAAKAMANWSGDDVLLLQNKSAPQFYDPHTLLRKVEEFRHPTRGDFVMKIKIGKRGGLGGRSMTSTVSTWRQMSGINTDTIEGFEPINVHRTHLEGLRGLRQGAAATWDDAAEGVQVELPTDGAAPILTGGSGHDRTPIFQLGCPELNRFGGITGWNASFSGTVHKVELWVQNPHYKQGERSLLDKVRGKNKPEVVEKSATKIKTAPRPKAKVSLVAKGQMAIGMVGKILNKAGEVPEHMSRQKLKTAANINKVAGVPACAFIRQPDGSVGFFVETCDDPRSAVVRSRVQPEEEAAAIREIMANKELQTKHVAKRLMTTMDAIQLKFEEASRSLTQSVGRGQAEEHLIELRAQRDNDMMDLEAQAKATLAMIERETEGHLARRIAHSVPEWVGSLLQESTAWQMLYPGRVPKKRKYIMDDDDAFDFMSNDDDKDDFKKPDAPCTAPTTWPKFVQVVCLAKTKSGPNCSAEQLGEYKATYRQDIRDPPVEVEKVILTPMVVHRNLGIHYQRRLVEGWTHDDAMEEIHKYCGLPVVWRGCLPFTGGFHPVKLLNAWRVNWTLWTLLLAWLAWSYLSLREELPWGGIIGTMMTSIVLAPASKIQKGLILGFVVYLFLEGPALYLRYTKRFDPDFDKDAKYVSMAERQKEAHEAKLKKQEDEDKAAAKAEDEEDGIVRPELLEEKPEKPPPVKAMSARKMVAAARPEKAYEAMQTGAALRELDKRKHVETTAVARRLVPKLDAETRRHEEELEQLEGCRSACTDSVAIETLDAQKSKMEREYAARMKEIEADAMLALANVERAHDRAIESCTTNSTIMEAPGAGQMVPYEAPPEEPEPERDEAAETAKLAAHQQAAMKIVAQHMIQQVDNVTSTHEVVMDALKAQLSPLGHTTMEDKMARRALEAQMKQSERAHNEHLKTLEEKASVALSHVEQQHQQAVAKLQQEFPKAAPSTALVVGKSTTLANVGRVGLGRYDYTEEEVAAQTEAARTAEALYEWSQLEDEKKATMRATAERLMAEMHAKQGMHDKVMAAAHERVENATTDVARALFTDDIRLHEEHHAKELQDLEEQASQALATIDRDFSSRSAAAKQAARPAGLRGSGSNDSCGSAKRMTVSSSREQLMNVQQLSETRRTKVPQSEARMQAINWLETSERRNSDSEREGEEDAGRKVRQAPGSSSKVRVQSKPPVVRVANSAAAQRARGVRQAYETLGVDRNINDSALDRVYAALLHRENPENNPADCAGYYANKTKEIRAAYSCVRSNRRPGQPRAPQMGASD